MLFNTAQYGLFFVAVFTLHWLLPRGLRRPWLLIASYYFYASAIPQYLLLIWSLTIFGYLMGRWIAHARGRARTVALWIAIAGNLGSLAYFKYSQLLLSSLRPLLHALPLMGPLFGDPITLDIILPLGISFFTFEFIHYVVEVYKGHAPIANPADFALFAAFFPTQIAGPIKRFPDFMKQVEHPTPLRAVNFDGGVWLILRGLVKKVLLADMLAPFVAQAFARPGQLGWLAAWAGVLAFAAQIYGDFSGYTDMGRGSATLLGYAVPENFASPYQAANTSEFWHRWHMSLSTWLRDYLYIPLGGSRAKPVRVYVNLMITMALGGLWHGASWHFMVWGIYEGALLCFHRLWQRSVGRTPLYRRLVARPVVAFLCRPVTLVFVCAGWVFFRANTLPDAFAMLGSMFAFTRAPDAGLSLDPRSTPILLLFVAGGVVLAGWLWAVVPRPAASLASTALVGGEGTAPAPLAAPDAATAGREAEGRLPGKGAHLPQRRVRDRARERVALAFAWGRGQLDAAWLRTAYVLGLRPAFFVAVVLLLVVWPPHAAQRFIYFQF